MNKSELAYKRDTGLDYTFHVESEILSANDDGHSPYRDYCAVNDFPDEYILCQDIYIPDPAYIRWLEEKYEELTQLKEKKSDPAYIRWLEEKYEELTQLKEKKSIKMTDKEQKLLEIAIQVIELNSELEPALTGSLMLAHRGIEKRREARDIDIICKELCEDDHGRPIVPKGFKFINKEGAGSSIDAMSFTNEDGIKIDFMYSEEETEEIDGIPCSFLFKMIEAKNGYSDNDKSDESRQKHLEDIRYLESQLTKA